METSHIKRDTAFLARVQLSKVGKVDTRFTQLITVKLTRPTIFRDKSNASARGHCGLVGVLEVNFRLLSFFKRERPSWP